MTNERRKTTANIGLAIWRLKCFYETFVQGSTTVILLNFCAKIRHIAKPKTVVRKLRMTGKKNIETIQDLQEVVDKDSNNHRVKDLAVLLLKAMTDWPTYNQTEIVDFVKELKVFYGHPLTLDKIDNKKINLTRENDIWRHEAGSSISEMIEISTQLDSHPDFDTILQDLLNYYERKKPAHNT